MLWKFYPFGGPLHGGYMGKAKHLSEFLQKHLNQCHPRGHMMHLDGCPGFYLITESPNAKTNILNALVDSGTELETKQN